MKFSPKETFKHGFGVFEAGNSYDSALHGLSDEEVLQFHRSGWAEVEGQDPAPPRQINPVVVNPKKATHKLASMEVKGG